MGLVDGLRLNRLTLSGNDISALDTQVFSQTGIEELYLDSNQLTRIPVDLFDSSSLSGLRVLDLSRNVLAALPDHAFDRLTSLQNLDLSSNVIRPEETESDEQIQDRQGLSEIQSGLFDQLSQLTDLDLSGNWLTELPQSLFSQNSRLERLDLSAIS